MKVLIFTSTEVFNITKATPKECVELKIILGLAPTFQVVASVVERKKDIMRFTWLKKKGDNPVTMVVFFLMMIDYNVHPSCQLVHQHFLVYN